MFSLKPPKKRAVAYYRHSAEDKQENSVHIQREHTEKFADKNQIEIIHEETDEGKSGLLADRPGFDNLLKNWILNTTVVFDYVLVYDVSRWGRFQDQDEAAHYEFLCKKNNKKVIYVTHGFPKDDQRLLSSLQTSLDRYMAAEYSRQLSEKVFYGSVKVSEQGYSAGGGAPYGMTRVLLDESKKPIGKLKKGEHKVIANQRVTFTPTNDETTETVKEIFHLYIEKWYYPQDIADTLNTKGVLSPNGKQWDRGKIINILSNPTYTGTRIYNKTWGRLKQKKRNNPREEWVICPNAFDSIVNQEIFNKTQELLFWSMPSRWKRGVYAIHYIRKKFVEHFINLLETDKNYDPDMAWYSLYNCPLIVSVTNNDRNSSSNWCFLIKEDMKKYQHVIGIGVDMYKKTLTHLFILPTEQFGVGNYLILSQNDPLFNMYVANEDKIGEEIIQLDLN